MEVATIARAMTLTFLVTRSRKDGLLDPSLDDLFAVGVTHSGGSKRFHGRFVAAYFEHLHLNAYLFQ